MLAPRRAALPVAAKGTYRRGAHKDNNPAERAWRGPVIGRKLSFGSHSEQGARLTGRLLSVYGTLELAGLNPQRWTCAYLQACAEHGGRAPPDAAAWLPWNLDPERARACGRPDRDDGPPPSGRERTR